MNKIKILPQNLINKIAAGKVVERPASIVKELIENSIDAGANDITLKLVNNGLKEITVTDNGSGINAEEVELAFTQHATSKITNEADLEKILTLGFRGEALASIAAIADIEIHTFKQSSKPTKATISNSTLLKKETSPRSVGTSISVIDIFKGIPARKKFLSSEYTEYKHIYNTFISLALSRPDIHFRLLKDNKEIKNLHPSRLEERIGDIFGKEISSKIIPIYYDSPDIKISGFIGHPEIASDTTPKQFIFLNKRPIQEKSVYAATRDGFSTSMPKDRKPTYFIFINIDPKVVDVNVHPRKSEVKFINPNLIYKIVKQAVEKSIIDITKISFQQKLGVIEITSHGTTVSRRANIPLSGFSDDRNRNISKKNLINQSIKFTENILNNELNDAFKASVLEQNNKSQQDINFEEEIIYIGQVFNTYLIFQKGNKLLIIDQHAADERVNFEMISNDIGDNKKIVSQELVFPFTFEVRGEDKEQLLSQIESLAALGIELSPFGEDTFQLSAIPSFMKISDVSKLINELLSDIEEGFSSKLKTNQLQAKLISTIACHGSIRAGDRLEKEQAKRIITNLMNCKLPYSCPHGRPIIWELKRPELARKFERP